MARVAKREKVGFVNCFHRTKALMNKGADPLTINGCHLNQKGIFISEAFFTKGLSGKKRLPWTKTQAAVIEKNTQHFYRYRPLNTFYYTGGRRKLRIPRLSSGHAKFRSHDCQPGPAIHRLVNGENPSPIIDDSNASPLPITKQSRGANKWMNPQEESNAFKVDPRFEVSLFASEEQFPELACPIQMRWDGLGRMWVSCSTTYLTPIPVRLRMTRS